MLLDQVAFTVGRTAYRWADVVLAARLWGEWAALEKMVCRCFGCREREEELREPPSEEAVASAAAEFRYARDLISAEEAEGWLARWGLTTEKWMDYVERTVCLQTCAKTMEDLFSEDLDDEEEIRSSILVEALCSGRLAQFADKLAGRAAVYEKACADGEWVAEPLSDEDLDTAFGGRARPLLSEWPRESLETLARFERAFQRFCRQTVTPKAIADQVSTHYLDWIRITCRSVAFPDEQAAREAVLCLRDDRRDIGDVAAEAGTEERETRFYLDEIGPDWKDQFTAAGTADVLGPLPIDGAFRVFLVLDKRMPSADDPEVRQRATAAVIRRALDQETAVRVKWHSHP